MKPTTMRSPLTRHAKNPILSPEDMPFPCYTVFNAGAILHEGEVILLLRVEDLTRATNFYVARSRDGINFTVETEPVNYPQFFEYKDRYFITYCNRKLDILINEIDPALLDDFGLPC